MSAYDVFYFRNQLQPLLSSAFSNSNNGGSPVTTAHLLATRAHLAQSQYWAILQYDLQQQLSAAAVGAQMKSILMLTNQPLVLLLGTNGRPGHASVVYGWNPQGFLFYDVNFPGQQQVLPFNGSNFGAYGGFNTFGYVAFPSLGRTEDFAQLTSEARSNFNFSNNLTISNPTQSQTINQRQVTVSGTVQNLTSGASLLLFQNGLQQAVPLSGGAFSSTMPVQSGTNTIVALAGVNISSQSNWHPNSATLVRTFNGSLPGATFRATLTWNQNNADVDLYATDPINNTSWYASRVTPDGMALDFDNTTGFGPENITLSSAAGNTVRAGNYRVRVHYYSGTQAATGNVLVILNEGQTNQTARVFTFGIATSNSSNDAPGSVGADWENIASVDVPSGTITPGP
jgi:uncharacterized protein YfaP (DUF2135 family)